MSSRGYYDTPKGTSRTTLIASTAAALIVGLGGGYVAGHSTNSSSNATAPPATTAATGAATSSNSAAASANPAASTTVAPAPALPKIGTAIVLTGPGGLRITATVVKVLDPATPNVAKPEAGTRFVGVELKLVNDSTTAWDGNGLPTIGAKLIDTSGQAFGPIIASTNAGQMYTSKVHIAAGGTQLGAITFQVPKASIPASVQIPIGQTGEWQVH